MKRIKYISYYDTLDSTVKRNYVLAASNKMDYIISTLNKCGVAVDIISFSGCISDKLLFDKGGVTEIGINTIRHFSSFAPTNRGIVRFLSRLWQIIQFIFWFLYNVHRNEQLLVYHSLGYCRLLTILKKLKKCSYIGEIEEIYQDVTPKSKAINKAEYAFINVCDRYIFPTHLLNEKLNIKEKPSVLIHGIYEVERARNVSWGDSDVHVVYAGTFDPNKGGAVAAVNSVSFLPDNYHMHICGFGSEQDTAEILELIHRTSEASNAKISYEGLLKGEDFICLLQKCQIGLSTQNPTAAFNATSFPSKVLTYLANGLSVVSIRIPAIEKSAVGDCLSYYNEQSPMEIAQAIIQASTSIHKLSSSKRLKDLDKQFSRDIKSLLCYE